MATISASRNGGAIPSQSNAQAPASTHQYTCNTCQVAFRFADTQKGHMKSDWHRYNLKRRVASLPPISSEVFSEKVLQARAATTAEEDRAGFQQVCEVCQRTYYSENSFRNHISSQKHKAKEAALGRRPMDDGTSSVMSSTFSLGDPASVKNSELDTDAEDNFSEVVDGLKNTSLADQPAGSEPAKVAEHGQDDHVPDAPGEIDPSSVSAAVPERSLKSCLFCNYDSPTVDLNVVHMERIHSMFIPEKQYLVDLEGLLGTLQSRVQDLFECLYCGKYKNTSHAVQTHMRDKGHCKIPYTTEDEQLEIGEHYDFRSTYSDGEEDSDDESVDGDKQPGGAKLGAKRPSKAVGEDGDEIVEDEGWETDSSASSCASDDLKAIPVDHHYNTQERLSKNPHHSSHDPRHHHQVDGWHSHAHKHRAIFYDDTEMHLPSGRAVGHRSMAKYYRQNLHNYPTPEERTERLALEGGDEMDVDGEGADGDRRVATREQRGRHGALVPRTTGIEGVSEQKKKEVHRAEKRARRREDGAARRKEWGNNKVGNSQKYYKPELLQ